VLPILDDEQEASHHPSLVSMLQQHAERHLFGRIPEELRQSIRRSGDQLGGPDSIVPCPSQGISQVIRVQRLRGCQSRTRPGVVGFLQALVSPAALGAREDVEPTSPALSCSCAT